MSDHIGPDIRFSPAALDLTERVLGVPLVPPGVAPEMGSDDIRQFACKTVSAAVRRILHDRKTPVEELEVSDEHVALLRAQPQLSGLPARVQVANDLWFNYAQPPPMPAAADQPHTRRAKVQARSMRDIITRAQQAPHVDKSQGQHYNPFLTIAPMGSGKTALQALTLKYSGIGLPINETYPEQRRAVVVVPSQILVRQMIDPSETFMQFLAAADRDITVGAYYANAHQGHDECHALVTTPRSYMKALSRGAIYPDATVSYVVDEAHGLALAPKARLLLGTMVAPYLFTATEKYDELRDLKQRYPHSHAGKPVDFIRDGILSPVQLFTYRSEGAEAFNLAVNLAADYVRNGLKTLIVCEPGGESLQAQAIAEALNQLYASSKITPHPSFKFRSEEIASAVGKFANSSTAMEIDRIRRGERLILTTVDTGREGLNIRDLDGLILLGKNPEWRIAQWVGRVLRKDGDKSAVVSEVLPRETETGRPIASVFGAFGLEKATITAGYYIGQDEEEEFEDSQEDPAENISDHEGVVSDVSLGNTLPEGEQDIVGLPESEHATETKHQIGAAALKRRTPRQRPDLYMPPVELQDTLVTGLSVAEVTMSAADRAKLPPEDYKPLTDKAPEGVPVEWLFDIVKKLNDPAMRYVGAWVEDESGETHYVRFYSPATHAYFDSNPVAKLVSTAELGDEAIARLLGASRNMVRRIINQLQIEPLDRITKHNRSPLVYSMKSVKRIANELEKIPIADETDVPVVDLGDELGNDVVRDFIANPANGITAISKRRNPLYEIMGVANHVTAEDAERVRLECERAPIADNSLYISFSEMAARAEFSPSGFMYKFNDLDDHKRPEIVSLRANERSRPSDFVLREWGEAYADSIKPRKLQPWEVTQAIVAAYFGYKLPTMTKLLDSLDIAEPEIRPLPGVKAVRIYPFSILLSLIDRGLKPASDAPNIDRDSVVLTAEQAASDPESAVRNQLLQAKYINAKQIAPLKADNEWEEDAGPQKQPNAAASVHTDERPEPKVREQGVRRRPSLPVDAEVKSLATLGAYTEDSWISLDEAMDGMESTLIALQVLSLRHGGTSAIGKNNDGSGDMIKGGLYSTLSSRQFFSPQIGWVSHDRVLADARGLKLQVLPDFGLEQGSHDVCRSEETRQLDLYYSPTFYKGLLQRMRTQASRLKS